MLRRPPRSTLFPTRRSSDLQADHRLGQMVEYVHQPRQFPGIVQVFLAGVLGHTAHPAKVGSGGEVLAFGRSEEHTSELQSRPHLVCRLLLEKKKKANTTIRT